MSKVYVFMADGTEEVEALTVIDLLRRAKADVVTVSIMKDKKIISSHNIGIEADELYGESDYMDGDMIVFHCRSNLCCIQRVIHVSHTAPFEHGEPEAGIQAEGVEKREIAQNVIMIGRDIQQFRSRHHIGVHIMMCEHNAFRIAGGPAGEEKCRRSKDMVSAERGNKGDQFFAGQKENGSGKEEFLPAGDLSKDIIEINQRDAGFHGASCLISVGCQNMSDICFFDGCFKDG